MNMKKLIKIIILVIIFIVVGECASTNKSIIGQQDNQNVWQINHMFNLFHTTMLAPINDTTDVVVIDKKENKTKYITLVSDGNNVTTLRSKKIYDIVEIGDSTKLVTTYEPQKGRNGPKKIYTIIEVQ